VIDHPHIDQTQRIPQYIRDALVGLARLRDAARMVVRDDDGNRGLIVA
jgi:hypothetical protein